MVPFCMPVSTAQWNTRSPLICELMVYINLGMGFKKKIRIKNIFSRKWLRSIDLWVMGPARFHCATLLVNCCYFAVITLLLLQAQMLPINGISVCLFCAQSIVRDNFKLHACDKVGQWISESWISVQSQITSMNAWVLMFCNAKWIHKIKMGER